MTALLRVAGSLAAASLLGFFTVAANLPASQQTESKAEKPTRADCAACHEKEAGAFALGAHGRAMAARSADLLEKSCVDCHSPADAHMNDPVKGNITVRPDAKACLSCHALSGTLPLTSPAHTRNRVDCLDCHISGHSRAIASPLLLAPTGQLCARCHASEASSFFLPFAHREGRRPYECGSCHTIHGSGRKARLSLAEKDGVCIDCHTETKGPFVYAHPPSHVSGCLACHLPHGSTNPRLLTRHQIRDLCLECHAGIAAFHDLSKPRYRNCVSCHVAVHGSNRDPRLLDE